MGRIRLLTEAEVTQLLPMSLALETVESAVRGQAAGQTVNKPRVRLRAPKGLLQVMPAVVPEVGAMGLKAYTVVGGRGRVVGPLFSTETGGAIGSRGPRPPGRCRFQGAGADRVRGSRRARQAGDHHVGSRARARRSRRGQAPRPRVARGHHALRIPGARHAGRGGGCPPARSGAAALGGPRDRIWSPKWAGSTRWPATGRARRRGPAPGPCR